MKVNWKLDPLHTQPFLFKREAHWTGVELYHRRLAAGELLEQVIPVHEINMTLAGSIATRRKTATGATRSVRYTNGGMCLSPAGQFFGAEWEADSEFLTICIEPKFFVKTARENHFSADFEFVEGYEVKDPLLQQLGLALLSETQSAEPVGRLYADSLINALTIHLLKNYSTARHATHELNHNGGLAGYKLRRVNEYIHAHLEQDLSLAELAAVAALSQFHFARAFRRTTGVTPQAYVMRERIERAKILLANETLPLVEVSLRAGFKNQSHFTTLFRKLNRVTPKMWRELKLA